MNKYVKFLLKCILAASPAIVLIAYTILFPFCYMDKEYPSWKYTRDVIRGQAANDKNFDTVILGDSGAMSSFVPGVLSDSCVNLAVGGATPIEMYYFLNEYLKHHDSPKCVVMMFSPFHYSTMDNFETRTRYFNALSISDSIDLYKNAKEYDNRQVDMDGYFVNELSYRCGLPTKYLPAITAARIFGRGGENKASYAKISENFGYGTFGTLDGCSDLSYECTYTAWNSGGDASTMTAYVFKIINLCMQNDITFQLVQPAFNDSSYKALNENYVAECRQYFETLTAFVDFRCELDFKSYPDEYFGDASHLNEKGAVKFSEDFLKKYPELFD